MIATILPSTSNFHAIGYNEHKRKIGTAELLETHNIPSAIVESRSPDKLQQFFIDYSKCNDRIKKPQFHVAISCKGQEYTKQQLVEFAHEWLSEMGYDNEGQPWAIYAHNDTDNCHIHIVTSRVDPTGKKIDHNHERRRSQAAIDKILSVDPKQRVEKDVATAMTYQFDSPMQFRVVMESLGYKSYVRNGIYHFTKGGGIKCSIPAKKILSGCKKNALSGSERFQLYRKVQKYKILADNKEELKRIFKSKLGFSFVFFGPKDNPYGYAIVDHAHHKVYRGQQIMRLEQLLDFMPVDQRLERIDEYIHDELMADPKIGLHSMAYNLACKYGVRIKDGEVVLGDGERKCPIKNEYLDTLKLNDKILGARFYNITTAEELSLMARLLNISPKHFTLSETTSEAKANRIETFKKAFEEGGFESLIEVLNKDGFYLHKQDGKLIAANIINREVIDLSLCGIILKEKSGLHLSKNQSHLIRGGSIANIDSYVELGQKRDWEIDEGRSDDYTLGLN